MINRDDIEAGDKCYTRDGGCLVARDLLGTMQLGGLDLTKWIADRQYVCDGDPHPLTIADLMGVDEVRELVEAGCFSVRHNTNTKWLASALTPFTEAK